MRIKTGLAIAALNIACIAQADFAKAVAIDLSNSSALAVYLGEFPDGQIEESIFLVGAASALSSAGSVGLNNDDQDVLFSTDVNAFYANGNALVRQVTGSNPPEFYRLTVTAATGFQFTDLVFRSTNADDITITANYVDGSSASYTFLAGSGGGGQNDDYNSIMVLAQTGAFLSLVLTSEDGWGELRDFGISGYASIPEGQTDVPLPPAVMLFATALAGGAGFGAWRRRQRKVQAQG